MSKEALNKNRAGRQSGPEALRCVAMLLVTVLHYLGKGNLLPSLADGGMDATGAMAWLLESFAIVAVNCYILISGYFSGQPRAWLGKGIRLYLRVWVFSAGIGLLCAALGVVPAESLTANFYLKILFPVSMGHYWFMTAYLFFYLLLPLVSVALAHLNAKQTGVILCGMLLFHCILKSILPFYLDITTNGYDWTWFFTVFLAGAYLRKADPAFLKKRGLCLGLYVGGCFLVTLRGLLLAFVYRRTGMLGPLIGQNIDYNQIFVLLAALGLFGVFLSLDGKISGVLARLAPYTLGVYLLQENLAIRFLWPGWLGSGNVNGPVSLILHVILAALAAFAAGVAVDWLIVSGLDLLGRGLERIPVCAHLMRRIRDIDACMAKSEQ
jgi:surface polysaccharide O-acyltransferase-like enzyme